MATARERTRMRVVEGAPEGELARQTESVTARIPSLVFLGAAIGSMIASAALQVQGRRGASLFVGQWAPAFLILGVYSKLTKVAGPR